MLRKRYLILLVVILILLSVNQVALLQDNEFTRDTDTELQILTELNRWRIHTGLGPLMRNPDLDDLAMQQADYIKAQIPFQNFDNEEMFHRDEWGDGIVKRAAYYGWPAYDDDPNKELISEIAAYFPSVSGSIHFWENSKPHHDAVETGGFREAGVAVLRRGNWLLTYVELAGRPNVLPIMFDAAHNMLYLSLDQSYNAEPFTPLFVRIQDSDGNNLHKDDWLVWSNKIRLPSGTPNNITVTVSDGLREISTDVDLKESLIFPSDPIPTSTKTSLSTFSPITLTPSTITATTPPVTVTPLDGAFQVTMVYNATSFSMINAFGRSLDLSKLVIRSDVINFERTAQWLGRYSKVPLDTFPATWCMQVWSFRVFTGPPALPDGCTMLASGRSLLNPGDRFWLANRFDVYYGGDMVASCYRDNHECGFDVPAQTN